MTGTDNDQDFWDSIDEDLAVDTIEKDEEKEAEEKVEVLGGDKEEISSNKEETDEELFERLEKEQEGGSEGVQEDVEEEGEKKKVESLLTLSIFNSLKEKGLIEVGDDEEVTEDNAEALLEDKYEETLEKRLTELLEDLPEDIKALNNFVLKGGNASEFLKTLSTENVEIGSLDLENEKNQIKVMETSLREEGFEEEDIQDQIQFLKDSKKLKTFSEKKQEVFKKRENTQKEELLKRQDDQKRSEKESVLKMKKSITDLISEKEDLRDFSISTKDKKELPNYITDKNIKLQNGGKITSFQKDLMESLKDPEKVTMLAKILKSGFDFSEIKKKSQTEVTKKVKNDLRRTQGKKTSSPKKNLLDYF